MRKIIRTFFVTLVVVLLFPKAALGFGITPAEIYVEDLKPGGHLEKEIYVTRQPDEVNEALDVVLETDLGEMESWFSFDPGRRFTFPIGKNVTSFRVVVDVPRGVDIKNFKGRITAKGETGKKASAGVTIIKGAILGVDISTSDSDDLELRVLSMEAPDVNNGDSVRLLVSVENIGNVAAALDRVDLEVMDVFEKPIESLSDTTLPKIDPFTTRQFQAEFNSNLEKGQYRIDASAIFMGEEILRKKMILTVNAKPTKVDEKAEYEAQKEVALKAEEVNYKLGLALIALGGLLLALILLIIFKKAKVSKPRYAVKLSKLLQEKKIYAQIAVSISLFLIALGLYFASAEMNSNKKVEIETGSSIDETMQDTKQTDTENEEVKGVATEVIEVAEEAYDNDTSLKVNRPGTPGMYPIFSEPDFGAEIIYEAEDGEIFDVTTIQDEWYKVLVEDGTSGWLHKNSIKSH